MTSHIEGSVSKGVFAFKGKKKRANPDDYCDIKRNDGGTRHRLCKELWETVSDRVQVLQSSLNTKIFDDLLKFVSTAHEKASGRSQNVLLEIPTAALITGVNSPDHALMFTNLTTLLQEHVTPFVCQLKSKDCTNVKSIVSKTVSLLMETPTVLEDEEVDDQPNMKRISPTFSVLASWYAEKRNLKGESPEKSRSSSPRKRKAGANTPIKPDKEVSTSTKDVSRPSVVLVLPDLESFPAHVLQDFVTICSNHLKNLPIVLVFGIATSVTAVHKLLPHAASSLLCMEKFQAPPSSEYLTNVINEVLMTADIPFKLGHKVFTFLLDMFLFHDFSVINFIRGLQFSFLDHFYNRPYSVLCQGFTNAQGSTEKLSKEQLESIRQLPSFQKFVEANKVERSKLMADDKAMKEEIVTLLRNLEDYHRFYFPVLKCLHVFASKLPKYPIGKQIRELYALNLSSHICEVPEYKEALTLMKALSKVEIVENLKTCQGFLNCDTEFDGVREQIQDFLDKFENVEELQRQADLKQKEAEGEEANLPKKTDMYTLRQKLQELEKKKKKFSVYEELRNNAMDYMDKIYNQYLVPPHELPLHEIYYYDDVSVLRRTINGSPRATIQWALSDPHHYLQNESLMANDDGSISPDLPDICIVFKLHLECGRMINLYDWLQAFMMIVTAAQEEPKKNGRSKKGADTEDTRVLQARFIRAVSELQFLGFIKPTKRKTDHVARLTWGGC